MDYLLFINLIEANYLLVEVDEIENKPVKPSKQSMKKQCINWGKLSPSDCNSCSCVDDGNCTEVMGYTKIECPTEQRNAGEFCDLSLNNCADGFKCQKVNDVCDDVNEGRCLKIWVWWKDCSPLKATKMIPLQFLIEL